MRKQINNNLIDILREAKSAGLSRELRHEVCVRYHNAMDEFKRYNQPPKIQTAFTILQYERRMMEHAALKARNYITRHIDGGMGRDQS